MLEVFASFYLCDLSFTLDTIHSLGPFVAASSVVQWVFVVVFIFFQFASLLITSMVVFTYTLVILLPLSEVFVCFSPWRFV